MVRRWKDDDVQIAEKYDDFGMPMDLQTKADPHLSEMKKYPPSKFIVSKKRCCDYNNYESIMRSIKNIPKIKEKLEFKKIYEIFPHLPSKFVTKDVVKALNAEGLTDNDIQNKVLSYMVCMGMVNKDKVLSTTKKGKIKIKYHFTKKNGNPCPYLKKSCTFDWELGEEG